ncbi:MAG: Scr1 family TA system antitoxin-like transcriptional regulator [Pseudonocardia sp.]
MLDLYDVGGDRWTELIAMTREARQRGWWRAYGLGDNTYVGFETEASLVQEFTLGYVPGLLQTADYARALLMAIPVRRTGDELANDVVVRTIRQRHLAEAAAHDTVTLQVLPADLGAHAALASGFTVLNFGDLSEPDIA